MKKIEKFFITFLFLMLIFLNNTIVANASEELTEVEEETIIKYNTITHEKTIVNMEELEDSLKDKGIFSNSTLTTASNMSKVSKITDFKGITNEINSMNNTAQRILDTSVYPSRIICKVQGNNYAGLTTYGSGTMVGPKVVLTNAHMVMAENPDTEEYEIFTNWEAAPGYNEGYNYGSAPMLTVYYPHEYETASSTQKGYYDWAIVVVGDGLDSFSEWAICAVYSNNSDLNGLSVRAFGYPASANYGFNGLWQYITHGTVSNVGTNYMHLSDTFIVKGFSGGPIMTNSSIFNIIVGIIQGWTNSYETFGVRINQNMVNLINTLNNDN